jgi:hypothetical protein
MKDLLCLCLLFIVGVGIGLLTGWVLAVCDMPKPKRVPIESESRMCFPMIQWPPGNLKE